MMSEKTIAAMQKDFDELSEKYRHYKLRQLDNKNEDIENLKDEITRLQDIISQSDTYAIIQLNRTIENMRTRLCDIKNITKGNQPKTKREKSKLLMKIYKLTEGW